MFLKGEQYERPFSVPMKENVENLEPAIPVKQGVTMLSKSNGSVCAPKSGGGSDTQPQNQSSSY